MNAHLLRPKAIDMTGWFEVAFAKYSWIWLGLTFGFAAKYALLLKRGVPVRAKLVIADLLLLPVVALISYTLAVQTGVVAEASAMIACFCTVGSDRLVKLYTDRFLRQVDEQIVAQAATVRGEVRQELQAEISAREIIHDYQTGRAPAEYVALKPGVRP